MNNLSTEALMISALAVMRDIKRVESELETMPSEDEEAWHLGEDVLRMTRVLGELQGAYRLVQAKEGSIYPNWDALVKLVDN